MQSSQNPPTQQQKQIIHNQSFLRKRQAQQFQILMKSPEFSQTDQKYLDMTIQQLQEIMSKDQTGSTAQIIFATFAKRSAADNIRKLNGVWDLNPTKIIDKNSYGIPFSVKDHIIVSQLIQTCGFSKNVNPSNQTAEVVKILEKQNCVAYAQTSVPQGLIGIECNSNVYGLSKNPWKEGFGSGGSAGGDGIAISTRVAAFSVSSDSAGSVRIPACFCGIYGFKPTGNKRISLKGRLGVGIVQSPLFKEIDTSFGFMTRNVEDIRWLCEKTLGQSPQGIFNPYLYNKWENSRYEETLNKKLTIGYIAHHQQIQTAPAIVNALNEVIELLKKEGHTVVEFQFKKLDKFRNFFFQFFSISGFMLGLHKTLGKQKPVIQSQNILKNITQGQDWIKSKIQNAGSQQEKQYYMRLNHTASSLQFYPIMKERDELKKQFLVQWQKKNIDFILSPTMPFTAPKQNQTLRALHSLIFCAYQNILELPAGNIPIRKVRKNQCTYNDNRFYGSQIKSAIEESQGLPVCLQLTGMHMKDEQCVAGMKVIENILTKNNLGYFSQQFSDKGKVLW